MAPVRGRDARVRRLERAIEAALAPGQFIGWRSSSEFLSGLEDVAAAIEPLIRSAPAQAAELYEAFLAGCWEKAEEIDDSGGDLGRFAKDLVCGWLRARQAMGADADETSRLLLARYDDDPYGFLYEAEKDLAKALDRPGLAAFERIVRSRWEEVSAARDGGAPGRELSWRDVLKAIYEAQGTRNAMRRSVSARRWRLATASGSPAWRRREASLGKPSRGRSAASRSRRAHGSGRPLAWASPSYAAGCS
jgi:hypothetical protein